MRRAILVTVMLVSGGLAVTGCQQQQKTEKSAQVAVKKYARATTLEGRVNNDKGPVKAGRVEAIDEGGRLIAHVAVDNGHYSVDIPADTVLPILLTFSFGPEEKLIAAVVHDTITQYDINPSSTAIAKAAKAMGGYTHANMTRAAADTVHTPDANKTTTGWRGDPTTQYGGWH
ncbi:hypothetical protein [Candidatus Methylobacter oryzae]|uniref:Carboxypeptidase regulatory-like domain-containing protein n=1 Tax=Candidatus Methylobacter oryzae TaxID=2497749 RepID=A0ABY3C9Z1_9GAMM|nr:hypothetical protein [Candidatus Methylobacter oryzae]TRW94555.1 hypothetical protein EKO24_011575 [Candidatus Methylobacter oryzae]